MRPPVAALTPLIALALVPATARADVGGSIFTIAGAGASHVIADGQRATSAGFDGVARVAVLPDGDVLVTSYEQVWRIHDGVVHAVAGTGEVGATGDGVPAREAALDLSFQVAADPAGGFVLTDGETRVRRVTPDGRIFTVAGNGKTPGRLPDLHGQPATSVPIDALDVAAGADGSVLIVEESGRVDRVAPDGAITAAAPAADDLVPIAVAAQPDGGFAVVDEPLAFASRIWRVAPDGALTPLAGTGRPQLTAPAGLAQRLDGGPAATAVLTEPGDVAFAPDGGRAGCGPDGR